MKYKRDVAPKKDGIKKTCSILIEQVFSLLFTSLQKQKTYSTISSTEAFGLSSLSSNKGSTSA